MLQPLKDRVLIERDSPKKTMGAEGIFTVAIGYEEKETTGTILAIGPDVKEVSVGDKALFGLHDGVSIPSSFVGYDGDFLIIRDNAIRGVLTNG